jgi:hypothetical protein
MSPPRGSSVPTDSYPGGVARGLRPNGVLAHSPRSVGIERALSDRRTFSPPAPPASPAVLARQIRDFKIGS